MGVAPKRLDSSHSSAVIIEWPKSFEVTLEIDPKRVDNAATVGTVAMRLIKLGGKFVAWRPNFDRGPAVAQFAFSHPVDRDRFVARALKIPGVSLASRRSRTD